MERKSITDIFSSKNWLGPMEYFLRLGRVAVSTGLITDDEFRIWAKRFQHLRVSPPKAVAMFEKVLQSKEAIINERGKFLQEKPGDEETEFDKVVKAAEQIKKQKRGRNKNR